MPWARLSVARSQLYFNGNSIHRRTPVRRSRKRADRAIALQPELGGAWLAQGLYSYRVLRDFQGALQL